MNELLSLAVEAHGGLERWNRVKSVKVAASITGAIWFVKSQGNALKDVVMTVDTKGERLVTDFPGQDKRSTFEPNRITLEKADGTQLSPATIRKILSRGTSETRPGMTSMSPISAGRLCGRNSILRFSTLTTDSRLKRSHRLRLMARRGDV